MPKMRDMIGDKSHLVQVSVANIQWSKMMRGAAPLFSGAACHAWPRFLLPHVRCKTG